MVLLLQVLDLPYNGIPGRGADNLQTGVYFIDGKPKPSATAFRFPFLADRRPGGRVVLWGKAPADGELTVTEHGKQGPIAQFGVQAGEVFSHPVRLGQGSRHKLRAEVGGVHSLTWTVK